MRATTGKLYDGGAAEPETLIQIPILDQFPADTPEIEIGNGGCGRIFTDVALALPEGDAVDPVEGLTIFNRADKIENDGFALPTHDQIDIGVAGQNIAGMVRRINSAVDGERIGASPTGCLQRHHRSRMGGRRSGMTRHDDVRSVAGNLRCDFVGFQVMPLRVEQLHLVAFIKKRPTNRQQTEWYLVTHAT